MDTVTRTLEFQMVIPERGRTALKLTPGMKFKVLASDGRIEVVPMRPLKSLRGALKLSDTNVEREEADRR